MTKASAIVEVEVFLYYDCPLLFSCEWEGELWLASWLGDDSYVLYQTDLDTIAGLKDGMHLRDAVINRDMRNLTYLADNEVKVTVVPPEERVDLLPPEGIGIYL